MKILIILFFLPIFAQAQVPILNPDSTYTDKGHKTGVLLITDAAYFPKLASTDTTEYAQYDPYGKLVKRKLTIPSSSTPITLTTSGSSGPSTLAGTVLNIPNYAGNTIYTGTTPVVVSANVISVDTSKTQGKVATFNDILINRPSLIAGANMTITGIFPTLTFNAILPNLPVYQVTAVPFANASGILTSDSTKLAFANEYLFIGATSSSGISGILMNQGRGEVNAQFSGMYFNVGSGKAAGGIYDASKGYIFQNRGNTLFQISTSAITGGVNTAVFNADLKVNGVIILPTSTTYAGLVTGATTPVPPTGAGTQIFANGHFFGWIGTAWKQLDN